MKILTVLALVAIPFLAPGPNYTVKWGNPEKAGGYMASYMPLGWVNNHFYTVQINKNDGNLIKVNEDANIADQKELTTGQKKFEADLVYMRGTDFFMITSDYENKEKTNYVRACNFSMDGKPGDVKWKKIASVKVEKNSERADFQYFFSQDSTKLLMLHPHDVKRSDPAKVSMIVVNTDDLKEEWKTAVDLPFEYGDGTILTAGVSNDGNVMIVASVEGEEGKKSDKLSTTIYSFTKKNKEFDEYQIKLEDKLLSAARISYTKNGKAVMTGFYNTTKNGVNKGLAGAYITDINPAELNNLKVRTLEMDPKTLSAITFSGALAKLFNLNRLKAYSIEEFEINEDGSGYVIAEQRYMTQSYGDNSAIRTYYFNHLVVFRFDRDQNIRWISTVPKQQVSSVSVPRIGLGPLSFFYFPNSVIRVAYKYNSFISMEKDGKLYILYNDHKKNGDARTVQQTKAMVNKKTALASMVIIDKEGNWNKEQLFRGKDVGAILETSSSYKNKNNGFLISAEKNSTLQYGFLEL